MPTSGSHVDALAQSSSSNCQLRVAQRPAPGQVHCAPCALGQVKSADRGNGREGVGEGTDSGSELCLLGDAADELRYPLSA